MDEKNLQTNIDALREFVRSKGWSIVAEKEIAHGYQLVVTDGINKTPVDLFTTGKTLIQGRLGKTLPKGAFDPSIITIGREIAARGGEAALAEVAKLHFKTTKTILQT